MKKITTLLVLVPMALNLSAVETPFVSLFKEIKEDTVVVDGIRYELFTATHIVEYLNPTIPDERFKACHARVLPIEDSMDNAASKLYSGVIEVAPVIINNGKEYTVYSIGDNAFRDCVDLSEVILPEGIAEFRNYAFAGCRELKMEIPRSLSHIYSYVFDGSVFAEDMDFTNVKYFGENAFTGSPFKHIKFGQGHVSFQCNLFADSNMESFEFEAEGDESYPEFGITPYSFKGCKLKEVRLPNKKINLCSEIFRQCPELERIIFPDQPFIRDGYYTSNTMPQSQNIIMECPKLKEIVVLCPTPPIFHQFYCHPSVPPRPPYIEPPIIDDYGQCVLKVPQGSEELYRADPVWGRFERIEGFAPGEYTGISEAPVAEVEYEATPVYYNLQGMQVKEPVKGQLYIRRTGAKTAKIIY